MTKTEIAAGLQNIAMGVCYNEAFIREAEKIHSLTVDDHYLLLDYKTGKYARNGFENRMRLQDLAIKIRRMDTPRV